MPAQYRAIWTVPGGGTGYSVFHADEDSVVLNPQAFANGVRQFFSSIGSILPDDVQVNFDSEVLILSLSGTLELVFAVSTPAEVDGGATGTYSRAAGGRIDWGTSAIVAGRRLTGRTYIVPLTAGSFDTEGVLTAAAISTLETAGSALITAGATDFPLAVWSRTHNVMEQAITATAPAAGAILRSRRD